MWAFPDLLSRAREKHVGMDDYWLAISLQRVRTIELLPRMIKPLELTTLREFFLRLADELLANLPN